MENNLPDMDIKEVPGISCENNYNVIKEGKVKCTESQNSSGETSDSELSGDESLSEAYEISQSEFSDDVRLLLKKCSVLLNRNLPRLPYLVIKKEVSEVSDGNYYILSQEEKDRCFNDIRNLCVETSDSKCRDDENNFKLKKEDGKEKYFDENQYSSDEISQSGFSECDSVSSNVEDTSQLKLTEDVKPMLKACYVLLNRNFQDSHQAIPVNNLPDVVIKEEVPEVGGENYYNTSKEENEKYFNEIQSLCVETRDSDFSDNRNIYKLRKKGKVKYFVESQNSCSETSHSELSENDSCSSVSKKTKHKLLEESKKPSCLHYDKSLGNHSIHVIDKHSRPSKKFKCSLCSTGWKYRQSFISHMRRCHPEVEPFLCEYRSCEQGFKTQKLLEVHNKMHLKYMCRFCKKLFARKYHMRKHVLKNH